MVKGRVQSRVVFVDLVDISEGGCKIKGSSGFAKEGDRITMKVGDISAPLGTVAWVQDRFAGVRFDGEMHPAVLDHLVAMAGNISEWKSSGSTGFDPRLAGFAFA